MTTQTQLQCRHSLRPLSVFAFCGQPIAAPRSEYIRTTRNLPPCPDCQNARNRAARILGATYRLPGVTWSN
jgi:hypothetical protein